MNGRSGAEMKEQKGLFGRIIVKLRELEICGVPMIDGLIKLLHSIWKYLWGSSQPVRVEKKEGVDDLREMARRGLSELQQDALQQVNGWFSGIQEKVVDPMIGQYPAGGPEVCMSPQRE